MRGSRNSDCRARPVRLHPQPRVVDIPWRRRRRRQASRPRLNILPSRLRLNTLGSRPRLWASSGSQGNGPMAKLDLLGEFMSTSLGSYLFKKQQEVIEICLNAPNELWVEYDPARLTNKSRGGFQREKIIGLDKAWMLQFMELVASYNNVIISKERPMLFGLLPGRHRVTLVQGANVASGMSVTIRVKRDIDYSYRQFGIDEQQELALKSLISQGRAVAISGSTGSGKTTLMNMLLREIAPTERLLLAQDIPELDPPAGGNAVELLVARGSGATELGWSEIIDITTRSRPSIVVVGELSVDNAAPAWRLLNTGHESFMISGHANSPLDFLEAWRRNYVLRTGHGGEEILPFLVRSLAAIVQIRRNRDYTRTAEIVDPADLDWRKLLSRSGEAN